MTACFTRAAALALVLAVTGCAGEKVVAPPTAPPAAAFSGPAELRGTIGSRTRLVGSEPLLVSSWGVVVNLDGTGSDIVPENLRGWLRDEMGKNGVGSSTLALQNPQWQRLSPDSILRDTRTAVVRVRGLVPPGATHNTRFDLLVEALDRDTDTTSLAGGSLWTTRLSPGGGNDVAVIIKPVALGRGPVFTAPIAHADEADGEQPTANPADPFAQPLAGDRARFRRSAVIIDGGRVTEPRRLELVLNEANPLLARAIGNTINERFRRGPKDREPTAAERSESVVAINVPGRYRDNPDALLELIAHSYPFPQDPQVVVDRMIAWAESAPDTPEGNGIRRSARLTCEALGAQAVPALRTHYAHPARDVRMVALRAGAAIGDESASAPLIAIGRDPNPSVRRAAAASLVELPRSSRANAALRALLSDPDRAVQVAAYESLAANSSPLVDRLPMRNPDGIKYFIDRVPSERPLVYVTTEGQPRLVLFGPQTGFRPPVFASAWNGRLLVQTPMSIAQAMTGLDPGDNAFVPVVARTDAGTRLPTIAQLFDPTGAALEVVIDTPEAREAFMRIPEQGATPAAGEAADAGEATDTDSPVAPDTWVARVHLLKPDRATRPGLAAPQTNIFRSASPGMDQMPLSVYYKPPTASRPGEPAAPAIHRIKPTLATVAYFLGHHPTMQQPQEGLDLTFGQVVDAMSELARSGASEAELELRLSPLAQAVAEAEAAPTRGDRPDTAGPDDTGADDTLSRR